jgi:hypothetical protein
MFWCIAEKYFKVLFFRRNIMYKKFLFLTSFVLVLSLAYNSYGINDGIAPKPIKWRYVPAALGPTSITMTAVTATDDTPPVDYYFECTNVADINSGWQLGTTYTFTGLTENTVYSFRVKARDSDSPDRKETGWAITIPATTDRNTNPPVLRLDFNYDANNDDERFMAMPEMNEPNTQSGFAKFIRAYSGREVNDPAGNQTDVIVDLSGNLSSARREDPCGMWMGSGTLSDPCYYSPRAGEKIFRDFIFGVQPSGITITLWGLGVNRDCNITIWAFDSKSTGGERLAKWYANGTYIFDANFSGGIAGWPNYDNYPGPPAGYLDLYLHSFKGRATADANYGRIILTSSRGPNSPAGDPFAFVNAISVEPNNPSQTFVPTKYAHRPEPFSGTEDVPPSTALGWRNGALVATHDLYLDTNEVKVRDATRTSHPGLLIYAQDIDANTYDPYGAAGFLDLDTTYYWKVDEVNGAPDYYIYPGAEVWSFTTSEYFAVDNFSHYVGNSSPHPAIKSVWKDFGTQSAPVTHAEVFIQKGVDNRNLVHGGTGISMRYVYSDDLDPYYCEARAAIADTGNPPTKNGLGIDPDWLGRGGESLTLWFYGQPETDANEKMYVKLKDSASRSAKIIYDGDMNDIKEPEWHEWNIALQEFVDVCSTLNLSNVSQITIGFGDGSDPAPAVGTGVVFFDDIRVYTTRCALVERSGNFAKLDYAPSAILSGDCVIDYKEIDAMADVWLDRDQVIQTKKPSDTNLVVYYPMNEGDGNKVYSYRDSNHCTTSDPCDANWTGTFWNNAMAVPGYYGTTWSTPGAPTGGTGCVYLDGSQGARIQCGDPNSRNPGGYGHLHLGIGPTPPDINAITLSIWAKWLGLRTWDPYLMSKGQGLLGKRGGYSENEMIWTLWESEGSPGAFGLGHYASGDTATPDLISAAGILNPFIGQWVHLAATFPHKAADPCDANSHARLYLNGGQVADGPWRFSHGYDPNIYLTIGQTSDQNAWPDSPATWYGYLDEVRIYNRVLEPNEIAYLADTSPADGNLWVPIPSLVEVYSSEPNNSKVINYKDFALVVNQWLKEELFPR